MKSLNDIAKQFRDVFEAEHTNIKLPFFDDFPDNCCEGASCFLAFYFMAKFPKKDVFVIHGKSSDGYENHYWVEVDGLIYDLTADQFDEVDKPIFGAKSHLMSSWFSVTSSQFASCFFSDYADKFVGFKKQSRIYSQVIGLVV
ncbi:hypothetical protein A9Q74_01010 [Colwellia sp. 39_35_sub15_T18]|nr:hypothetical protein A9Q74_01010 [Colwellia sp. 39_35_sub15_T18]